ncbi:helix-turn-helix domain-containing protein [Pseudoroseicyclus aestuarii]|uniref:AraC family transcriptional regulator n=1 Tax=Pseudoroseicyclus aestuarii TaxID=1795041 RepID=A0A318SQF8_9RHOB|nr:helix-turn-helix domain-containing protein [Pseudoroseicyclus aestuarii]PYE83655.1 AraC family transcriptional regulator [Pseudoroseicyclus aestuarii]
MGTKRYWNPDLSTVEKLPNALVVSCEQPGIMASAHWHAQVEVNYVFRGSLSYSMKGYEVTLGPGALALFWGGLPHRVVDTAEDTYYHAIHLPLVWFFRLRFAAPLQRQLMQGATLCTAAPAPEDDPLFTRLGAWLSGDRPELTGHAIEELLLRLERIAYQPHSLHQARPEAEAAHQAETASFDSVRRICDYIAENFREDIHSQDIALSADIHPKYAMSVFRKSTGMTLNDYVSLLRVSYAQALLMEDGHSVLEVAMDSGFGSVSAFNKCFRKLAGTTPSDYKRALRGPRGATAVFSSEISRG